ncbi:hypothetical protein SHAb15599_00183 [Acinetobacter phage SH-Ab 15599]|nr:hypothetical protein SHAb15599_00183 [Acinetobacter phage SH-Ab 15599]
MTKKIILDYATPFSEVMEYINDVEGSSERAARTRFVFTKIPHMKTFMDIYFGEREYKLVHVAEVIDDIKVRETRMIDKFNFERFFRDIEQWENKEINIERLKNHISALLEYTNKDDVEIIKKFIKLEQIVEFDDFGLETYNMLIGK